MNRLVFLAALALGACFSPTYNNPQCGPAGECPLGFTCEQGVCRQDDLPIDGRSDGPTDAPDLDAETDGPDVEIDAPKPACPPGSTASPDDASRCFFLSSTVDSWDTVRNDCLAAGGDLADVLSQAENDLITTTLAPQPVWIGGTDEATEGNWVWSVSGTSVDDIFTSWDSGEPNDPFFHMLNCMVFSAGFWGDEPCSDAYPGICRVPAI